MIYPHNLDNKLGFDEIRTLLNERCLSNLGIERVKRLRFSNDSNEINLWLSQVHEFRDIRNSEDNLTLQHFYDLREPLKRISIEGTHLEEEELHQLYLSLKEIENISTYLLRSEESESGETIFTYPNLSVLTKGIVSKPQIIQSIEHILDKYGRIKDNATPELARIRRELSQTNGSISRILNSILQRSKSEGLLDKDVVPTLRDGRLVIPVNPSVKRRIPGIVHDESATGKTLFIEPTAVVEANNLIRELLAEEKRESIRILKEIASEIRPHIDDIIYSYNLLATVDLIQAKVKLAELFGAIELRVGREPLIDWASARHPLLEQSLRRSDKRIVSLDIALNNKGHILIISGPNAGGKSVCLKTVGLLQYMLQCGLSIPLNENSRVGTFSNIMIDIGDEQSIEDDLSTYSSHLKNMKMMIQGSDNKTLLLIDEFGGGTEPQIGGAIAESVLMQFCEKRSFGVITTHYQNLKSFADKHEGVVNGAMLYDRGKMQPLFILAVGQPGSSFAIEIARKIGLPKEVLDEATRIVGEDYVMSDKYLQDIVRDKRYWEQKREKVHRQEKVLDKTLIQYEKDISEVDKQRRQIISEAKLQAKSLIDEANRRIELTIKQIKEAKAEKEQTRQIREDFTLFKKQVLEIDKSNDDEAIRRRIEQIKGRRERHLLHQQQKKERNSMAAKKIREAVKAKEDETINVGDSVSIKGSTSIGVVESIENNGKAVVVYGTLRTRTDIDKMQKVFPKIINKEEIKHSSLVTSSSNSTDIVSQRRKTFLHEIDVRGERGDEALDKVSHFIDDAILLGVSSVRILHGKGNGILRQLIREYLRTESNVLSFRDEDVRFGGAGITVVEFT